MAFLRSRAFSPKVKAGSMFSMKRLIPYSSLKFTCTCTSTVMPAWSLWPVLVSKNWVSWWYFQLQIMARASAMDFPPRLCERLK